MSEDRRPVSERDPPARFVKCYCTGVQRAEVIAAWRAGKRTVRALREALGVCGGCATCRPEVEQLIRELAAGDHVTEG